MTKRGTNPFLLLLNNVAFSLPSVMNLLAHCGGKAAPLALTAPKNKPAAEPVSQKKTPPGDGGVEVNRPKGFRAICARSGMVAALHQSG